MKIGFIGCGNMGEAMLQGILRANYVSPQAVIVHTNTQEKMAYLAKRYQVALAKSNQEVAQKATILILAVKPTLYPTILKDIQPYLKADTILVSITPAFTLQKLEKLTAGQVAVVRAMPNTPATIGYGMSGLCFSNKILPNSKKEILSFFASFGEVLEVEETQMKIVGSLSGSAPAFVFYFMQAFVEMGITLGMAGSSAKKLISQTLIGSAKLAAVTSEDFETLISQVCSPKGSTIVGIEYLRNHSFYQILQNALLKTTARFEEMSQENDSF